LTTIIKAEPVPESSHSRSWRWSSAFKESGVDRLFKKVDKFVSLTARWRNNWGNKFDR
jgi:hypothetical protein